MAVSPVYKCWKYAWGGRAGCKMKGRRLWENFQEYSHASNQELLSEPHAHIEGAQQDYIGRIPAQPQSVGYIFRAMHCFSWYSEYRSVGLWKESELLWSWANRSNLEWKGFKDLLILRFTVFWNSSWSVGSGRSKATDPLSLNKHSILPIARLIASFASDQKWN